MKPQRLSQEHIAQTKSWEKNMKGSKFHSPIKKDKPSLSSQLINALTKKKK